MTVSLSIRKKQYVGLLASLCLRPFTGGHRLWCGQLGKGGSAEQGGEEERSHSGHPWVTQVHQRATPGEDFHR